MITDEKYWTKFYQQHQDPFTASLFAKFCCKHYIKKHDLLLELGCGNGRDAIYFSKNLVKVDAIDLCRKEINYLNQKYKNSDLKFMCMDFSEINFVDKYDIVYSRFTLHSISEEQENKLFPAVYRALKKHESGNFSLYYRSKWGGAKLSRKILKIHKDRIIKRSITRDLKNKNIEVKKQTGKIQSGFFCIEVRGKKNSLYGLGKQVDKDCFIHNDHFRRFVDIDVVCKKLQNVGFYIVLAEENINFAPIDKENDYFVRIIAKK